jgi:hypothetical protein
LLRKALENKQNQTISLRSFKTISQLGFCSEKQQKTSKTGPSASGASKPLAGLVLV